MATINSDNYAIGLIDLYFEASVNHDDLLEASPSLSTGMGGKFRTDARSLGNITAAEIAPDVTYVEHYVNQCGKRVRDKTAVGTVSLTIPFTFDEINEANVKRFLMASTIDTNKIAPLQETLVEGSAQMVYRTDVGQDMTYFIPKCTLRPDGNLAMNDEDWWSGPMVLDILSYSTDSWSSKPFGFLLASPIDCT